MFSRMFSRIAVEKKKDRKAKVLATTKVSTSQSNTVYIPRSSSTSLKTFQISWDVGISWLTQESPGLKTDWLGEMNSLSKKDTETWHWISLLSNILRTGRRKTGLELDMFWQTFFLVNWNNIKLFFFLVGKNPLKANMKYPVCVKYFKLLYLITITFFPTTKLSRKKICKIVSSWTLQNRCLGARAVMSPLISSRALKRYSALFENSEKIFLNI